MSDEVKVDGCAVTVTEGGTSRTRLYSEPHVAKRMADRLKESGTARRRFVERKRGGNGIRRLGQDLA